MRWAGETKAQPGRPTFSYLRPFGISVHGFRAMPKTGFPTVIYFAELARALAMAYQAALQAGGREGSRSRPSWDVRCQEDSRAAGAGRVEPYGTPTRKPAPRHTADFGRARLSENDTDEGRPLSAGHELPNAYRCGHGKLVAKADRNRWRVESEMPAALNRNRRRNSSEYAPHAPPYELLPSEGPVTTAVASQPSGYD